MIINKPSINPKCKYCLRGTRKKSEGLYAHEGVQNQRQKFIHYVEEKVYMFKTVKIYCLAFKLQK